MITGIYKITSPNNKVYVGQSMNINRRFKEHKQASSLKIKGRLYRSFIKHGVENHIFEIIEQCDVNLLNERERYWQEFYNTVGRNGLNCRLTSTTDKTGKMSKETSQKMSKSYKDRNPTPYWLGKKRPKCLTRKPKEKNAPYSIKSIKGISLITGEILYFRSIADGSEFFNKSRSSYSINQCCLGKTRSSYNIKWEYTKEKITDLIVENQKKIWTKEKIVKHLIKNRYYF